MQKRLSLWRSLLIWDRRGFPDCRTPSASFFTYVTAVFDEEKAKTVAPGMYSMPWVALYADLVAVMFIFVGDLGPKIAVIVMVAALMGLVMFFVWWWLIREKELLPDPSKFFPQASRQFNVTPKVAKALAIPSHWRLVADASHPILPAEAMDSVQQVLNSHFIIC